MSWTQKIFLLNKRKEEESAEEVQETRIVEDERDTIALGSFLLTGQREGNFFVQETLTIDDSAHVVGDVTATNCIINGRIDGNVICANELYLGITAVIQGSVMSKTAIIEEGSIVNGTLLLAPRVEVTTLSVKIADAERLLADQARMSEIQEQEELAKPVVPVLENNKPLSEGVEDVKPLKTDSTAVQSPRIDEGETWW